MTTIKGIPRVFKFIQSFLLTNPILQRWVRLTPFLFAVSSLNFFGGGLDNLHSPWTHASPFHMPNRPKGAKSVSYMFCLSFSKHLRPATIMTKLGHKDPKSCHPQDRYQENCTHKKRVLGGNHGNLESEKPMGCNGMQWDAKEQRKKMKKGRTKTGTKLDMRTETEKTGTTARATHIKRMADKCRHHKLSSFACGTNDDK